MEKKMRYVWWGILIVLIVIAIWKLFLPHGTRAYIEKTSSGRDIVVYVTGAVRTEGLVHLPVDARLNDALDKAGLLPEANMDALNPAEKLKDGQKINVPRKPVPAADLSGAGLNSDGSLALNQESNQNAGAIYSYDTSNNKSKININTAGIEELDRLPGIGPALAERIVQYRTDHGWFSVPEDLKKVSGIGNKTYEKMADQVTVGP